ncbi:MAG: hypothetical protein ABL907_10765 [Hyphomicrobium sp.]
MTQSPRLQKYYVRVARLRIETAVVEVDAATDEEAKQEAIFEAESLSAAKWSTSPFDPASYGSHVETMVTGDDFDPPAELDKHAAAQLLEEVESHYLLLQTSSDEDSGNVVLQPWFNVDEPDLLASDLMRDWIAELQHVGVTHLSERLDDLAAGSPPMPSDRILFSAPRRRNPGDDEAS